METIVTKADVCIVGGGMAGLIAAISAARHQARVVLMQDRPMLGGNASSEIRMWIRGAAGLENRETGLLQEIELENIYRNPTMNFSLWDGVLWQKAAEEKNLTLLMNCACQACEMENGRIKSVTGYQGTTQTMRRVEAGLFLDCSGDSVLAPLCGAEYRVGREARAEFNESGALEDADQKTMGNTLLFEARETDHPCPFIPPDFAYRYDTDADMYDKNHDFIHTGVNFWWIELGGEQDTIRDAETLRDELYKVAYGVWDHIKNRGDHGAENYELEWIGILPGKRESRRYVGDVILTQNDLTQGTPFPDTVAFGGWTMDNHAPEGFRYAGYSSHHITPKVPYPIPYRALYSKNIENLLFAGRNISATHMALSSTRVMATCAVIGQAAGTAAALCVKFGVTPRGLYEKHIAALQQALLLDGCYLPGIARPLPRETREAEWSLPKDALAVLQNGWERPHEGQANKVELPVGEAISITWPAPQNNTALRLALDPDFSRESIAPGRVARTFAMRTHIFLNDPPLKLPRGLIKALTLRAFDAEGRETVTKVDDNRRALLFLPLPKGARRAELTFTAVWQGETAGLYALEAIANEEEAPC